MSSMAASQSLTLEDRNLLYTSQLQTRLANWMADLPPQLYNAPLRNLAIPGTHDSASFYIDRTSEISPGETKEIKFLIWLLSQIDLVIDLISPLFKDLLEQIGKNVVYNWSVAQDFCFTEQLNNGVRYFDFRVAWKKVGENDLFYFVHGLHGSQVDAPMQEIADWLVSHPKEVVLLDFNHLFMGDEQTEPHERLVSRHKQLIAILENQFGSMLCPPSDNVKLANLWENQYQVVVFYNNEVTKDHPKLWSEAHIVSPWPKKIVPEDGKIMKKTVDDLIDFLNQKLENHKGQNTFYVSQAILTPDTKTIVGNLSLKDFLTNSATPRIPLMPEILKWLKGKRSKSESKGMNIVIADFVDPEFILDVIKLNYPVSTKDETPA